MGVLRFEAAATPRRLDAPSLPTPAELERMNRLRARFVRLLAVNPSLAYWLMEWMDSLLARNGV